MTPESILVSQSDAATRAMLIWEACAATKDMSRSISRPVSVLISVAPDTTEDGENT